MSPFHATISEQIWDKKYRFKQADGAPIDKDVYATWERIAYALTDARAEPNEIERNRFRQELFESLKGWKFLPAGRITAGAGTGRNVTLFNCFVMGTVPDSMGGIFDMLREAALTMQQGGGIGYDFSTLRPKGALVKGVAADASGPLTFMDCWDAMCRTVMSAGSRRGAMMATMRCDHPDIMEYVKAKNDPRRLRMFNMSVLITDDFMAAVKSNLRWDLKFEGKVYETIEAQDLWDAIMRNTYDAAEPGVIFIDRINSANNLRAVETIAATNPCGEQPLPPYGACLLGSINLAMLVEGAFTDGATIPQQTLSKLVATAVRAMDNVVDVSKYPLPEQAKEAKNKRRIGLGVTGLADALIMCGLTYGSDDAVSQTEKWMKMIDVAAYRASVELAKEKGPYPLFNADDVLAMGTHASSLPENLRDSIRAYGLRNALLTSIAPTGTISLYAGNVSSGVEPVFAYSYTRKVLQDDGSKVEERVEDYAYAMYRRMWASAATENGGADHALEEWSDDLLPDYFVSAQTLPPAAHVRMQAAAQKWVDSSISKTINCPADISFEDFKEVYMQAWDMGCKGCTTYRPNDITGSVLSVEPEPEVEAVVATPAELTNRPDVLDAKVYKVKLGGDPAFYVSITDIEEGGTIRPYEVFVNTKNPEHIAWMTALTRMISAIFRRPQDSSFVVEELKNVFDPKGGAFWKGKYRPSVVAAIGQVIENHMRSLGYGSFELGVADESVDFERETPDTQTRPTGPSCPSCASYNMKTEAGCEQCLDCGHSKCG